jgi:hypothetical protein
VRWDEEHESILYPGSDVMVRPKEKRASTSKRRSK